MKTKIIPFDLETAKKIQAGEIEGRIKTDNGFEVRIVCWDRKDQTMPILACYTQEDSEGVLFCSITGKSDLYDLVLEVPDNDPQFKPFDKVLVRICKNCIWQPSIFSCQIGDCFYTVSGYPYEKENIIQYEGHEHLVGTPDKQKEE